MHAFFRSLLLSLFLIGSSALHLLAHEGMWLPVLLQQLNEKEMKDMGLRISIADIYSVNNGSLKDAVFIFGGGCTSEIISSQGLLLTNHHCGYSAIQSHSSMANNYLRDGFVAKTQADELSSKGLTATRIVRIDEVTSQILMGAIDATGKRNETQIQANIQALKDKLSAETGYSPVIKSMYYGNQYYVFLTEVFTDIRMVLAPPSYVGKYGYDEDNWMWPRHTGDFSMFRIYAGPDNKPAAYSPDNKPYKPYRHLEIDLGGVREGDFTMVYGFPGQTQEYLPSESIRLLMEKTNPARIEIREKALSVINAAMAKSAETQLQYAAKQSRISNYWKKWIGENRGLQKLNAVSKRQAMEKEYLNLGGSAETLRALNALEKSGGDVQVAYESYVEFIRSGPELVGFMRSYISALEGLQAAKEKGELDALAEKTRAQIASFYQKTDLNVDKAIFSAVFPVLKQHLPSNYWPSELNQQVESIGLDAFTEQLYSNSVFASAKKLSAHWDKSVSSVEAQPEPALFFVRSLYAYLLNTLQPEFGKINAERDALMQTYMAQLLKTFEGKRRLYPDANGTLRLAYGKVEGYSPRSGVRYHWQTTLTGLLEKYQKDHPDFHLPDSFLRVARLQDFQPYFYGKDLPVAFIGSNHTTGGNSGSPVLNEYGRLVGLNFDRSWESTMSDIMFDPERCRNIACDVRYICWVVDKVMGGGHLTEEMTLIEPSSTRMR